MLVLGAASIADVVAFTTRKRDVSGQGDDPRSRPRSRRRGNAWNRDRLAALHRAPRAPAALAIGLAHHVDASALDLDDPVLPHRHAAVQPRLDAAILAQRRARHLDHEQCLEGVLAPVVLVRRDQDVRHRLGVVRRRGTRLSVAHHGRSPKALIRVTAKVFKGVGRGVVARISRTHDARSARRAGCHALVVEDAGLAELAILDCPAQPPDELRLESLPIRSRSCR